MMTVVRNSLQTKDYAFLELKLDGNGEPGHFTGKASVYGQQDSYNDIVMPGAFARSLAAKGNKVPVLNQHDTRDPIGIALLRDSAEALLIDDGRLELALPSAKDAYTRVKGGLITGISIGYQTIREQFNGTVRQLLELDLWEVSLVTFPACPGARVTDVKSLDGLAADLATELKAGRVISAANREKLSRAHGAMQDASACIKELLDLTAEDMDPAKAMDALLRVKRAMLKLKDAQSVADAAATVDQMIDGLGAAFDQLLLALSLPDAPAPAADDGGDLAAAALATLAEEIHKLRGEF